MLFLGDSFFSLCRRIPGQLDFSGSRRASLRLYSSHAILVLYILPSITPSYLLTILVALLLQLWGTVQITTVSATDPNAPSKLSRGKKIAQTGVAIQLICFGLFSVIAIRFNFTSKRFAEQFEQRLGDTKGEKYCSIDGSEKKLKPNWRAILRVTNFASIMILVSDEALSNYFY